MENRQIVSTLNDLIQTCKDGEEGFRDCADDASNPQLKTLFSDRAQSCASAMRELQDLVRSYGGKPETGSSLSGALHRRWVDIKSAVFGKDDETVLVECERGEDIAVRSYREALEQDLPPAVRTVIERQYQGARQNHDQIKRMRDQMHSTSGS
jgi:uncharacterized protein (TIGR02284 family)